MARSGVYFFILLFSLTTFAKDQTPRVIYGVDNRLNYYETQDPTVQKLSESTAIITDSVAVTKTANGYSLKSTSYASQYGLCPTEPFYQEPIIGWCSATLVAPDIMLTAGHCISDTLCPKVKFVFGFAVKQAGVYSTEFPEEDVVGCKKVIARQYTFGAKATDYGIVQLERPVTHRAPLPINRSAGLQVGDDIGVIGYPAGLPVKIAFGSKVRAADPAAPYYVTNLDTYGGNSGSAVFGMKSGLIEGILVRGSADFVSFNGCRISNVCTEDGCNGEDVTRISEVLQFIPEFK